MLSLFFVDDLPTEVGQIYEFDNEDAVHAVRVLRIGTGEIFNLSDGAGRWSRVQVVTAGKKSAQLAGSAAVFASSFGSASRHITSTG